MQAEAHLLFPLELIPFSPVQSPVINKKNAPYRSYEYAEQPLHGTAQS